MTLKKNIPHATLYALDISEEALQTAKGNAQLNQTDIQWLHRDILSSASEIPETNIIVSNPPYITIAEQKLMQPNVLEHEPWLALFVKDDNPLLFYKAITEKAIRHLLPNGKLYFEINEQFGKETAELLRATGFTEVKIIKDLQGKDRIVKGQKSKQ